MPKHPEPGSRREGKQGSNHRGPDQAPQPAHPSQEDDDGCREADKERDLVPPSPQQDQHAGSRDWPEVRLQAGQEPPSAVTE
jgi:hypothetical protein